MDSLGLDLGIGGLLEGHVVEIYGTMTLPVIAKAQKKEVYVPL